MQTVFLLSLHVAHKILSCAPLAYCCCYKVLHSVNAPEFAHKSCAFALLFLWLYFVRGSPHLPQLFFLFPNTDQNYCKHMMSRVKCVSTRLGFPLWLCRIYVEQESTDMALHSSLVCHVESVSISSQLFLLCSGQVHHFT